MSTTEREKYMFTVKENIDGTPWIMLEPMNGNISILNNKGFLGFDLPSGTTEASARDVASYLNKNLTKLTYTNY